VVDGGGGEDGEVGGGGEFGLVGADVRMRETWPMVVAAEECEAIRDTRTRSPVFAPKVNSRGIVMISSNSSTTTKA